MAAGAVTLSVLAGCGSKGGTAEESGNTTAAGGEKTVLTMAIWGDEARKEAYLKTLEPFCEANNCEVKIELVAVADYPSKLAASLGANSAPDVVWLADGKATQFIEGDWLLDLGPYLKEDSDYHYEDLYESSMDAITVDGHVYGVPFSFGAKAYFYNKDLFAQAGLKTPDEYLKEGNWTYDTAFDLAEKISGLGENIYGLKLWCVGQETNAVQGYSDILFAYGCNFFEDDMSGFALNNENGKKVIQMIYDSMYKTGAHVKPGDTTAFLAGTIGMARENYSYMKVLVENHAPFEWGIVPQPYGDDPKGKIYTGYANWAVTSTSRHADLAAELVKFMTSGESQLEWCRTFMPPRASVMNSEQILNPGEGYPPAEDIYAAFVDVITSRGLYSYYAPVNWAEIQKKVQQDFELIWAGSYSVEDGLTNMETDINNLLQ